MPQVSEKYPTEFARHGVYPLEPARGARNDVIVDRDLFIRGTHIPAHDLLGWYSRAGKGLQAFRILSVSGTDPRCNPGYYDEVVRSVAEDQYDLTVASNGFRRKGMPHLAAMMEKGHRKEALRNAPHPLEVQGEGSFYFLNNGYHGMAMHYRGISAEMREGQPILWAMNAYGLRTRSCLELSAGRLFNLSGEGDGFLFMSPGAALVEHDPMWSAELEEMTRCEEPRWMSAEAMHVSRRRSAHKYDFAGPEGDSLSVEHIFGEFKEYKLGFGDAAVVVNTSPRYALKAKRLDEPRDAGPVVIRPHGSAVVCGYPAEVSLLGASFFVLGRSPQVRRW